MNEAIENEIYEVEEMIASFSHHEDGSNAEIVAELKLYLMRLKHMLYSHSEELNNATGPLSMGGEVSS